MGGQIVQVDGGSLEIRQRIVCGQKCVQGGGPCELTLLDHDRRCGCGEKGGHAANLKDGVRCDGAGITRREGAGTEKPFSLGGMDPDQDSLIQVTGHPFVDDLLER